MQLIYVVNIFNSISGKECLNKIFYWQWCLEIIIRLNDAEQKFFLWNNLIIYLLNRLGKAIKWSNQKGRGQMNGPRESSLSDLKRGLFKFGSNCHFVKRGNASNVKFFWSYSLDRRIKFGIQGIISQLLWLLQSTRIISGIKEVITMAIDYT